MMKKVFEWIKNDQYLAWAYVIVYFVNNSTEAFIHWYLREAVALLYLWTLFLYLYHTFVTGKYRKGQYFIAAQIFLAATVVLTFRFKVNFRFSILQDFASLVFFLFPCCSSFMNSENREMRGSLNQLLSFFRYVTFVTSFASVFGVYMKNPITHFDGEGYGKVRGFYHNYNDACLFAYVSSMISFYFLSLKFFAKSLWSGKKEKAETVIDVLNLIGQLWLLYIIQSRTAMISYGLGLLLLVLFWLNRIPGFRKHRFLIFAGVFLLGAAAVYVFVFTKYGASRNIYYYLQDRGYSSLAELPEEDRIRMVSSLMSGRYALWKATIEQIKLSPWFGYGLKSAGFTSPELPEKLQNVHNLLLNVMHYTGIVGTVLLGRIFWLLTKRIYQNRGDINIPLKALYYSFFSAAMLEPAILYNWRAVSAVFWIVTGFLATELSDRETLSGRP